jgi:hypothetical protein
MALAVLGVLTTLPLPFGRLPTTYQSQTLRILTITLVPAAWLKHAATSLAQADSATQTSPTAGRHPA